MPCHCGKKKWHEIQTDDALFVVSTLMAGSAAAQDARSVLQKADRAVGASAVNSVQYDATGWIRFLGQNFTADQDWNRVDLQSYTHTPVWEIPFRCRAIPQRGVSQLIAPRWIDG
jgi:hypothetical protein